MRELVYSGNSLLGTKQNWLSTFCQACKTFCYQVHPNPPTKLTEYCKPSSRPVLPQDSPTPHVVAVSVVLYQPLVDHVLYQERCRCSQHDAPLIVVLSRFALNSQACLVSTGRFFARVGREERVEIGWVQWLRQLQIKITMLTPSG